MDDEARALQEIDDLIEDSSFSKALACSEAFLATHPDHIDGLRARAHARTLVRMAAGAVDDLTRVIELEGERASARDYYLRAYWRLDLGRYAEAMSDLDAVLRIGAMESEPPPDQRAHFMRSYCLLRLGRAEAALEEYAAIGEFHAMRLDRKILNMKGLLWEIEAARQGRDILAEKGAPTAVDNPDNVLMDIEVFSRAKNYPEALRRCDDLIAAWPNHAHARRERAFLLNLMDDTAAALAEMDRVIEMEKARGSEEPADYDDRGRWRIEIGNHAGAVADFTAILRIEERHNWIYYSEPSRFMRAYALICLGELDAAARDIETIPNDYEIWLEGDMRSKQDLLQEIEDARKSHPASRLP
jgi:tetratricopeptide (TPR) repeat protein